MSLDNELEQDVTADSSPEVTEQPQQQTADPSSSVATQTAQPAAKQEEPFHMHPRFQQVIAEKNELRALTQALQAQMKALESQIPKSAPAKDELMERLKGIDSAFADRFGKISEVDALKQELAEIKAWREQSNAQTAQQTVASEKEKFYTENKVPANHRKLYEAQLVMAAQANPNLKMSDLTKVMKSIHEEMSALFTTTQREATKQLVETKKVEAAKPSTQPKGVPASSAQKQAPLSKADQRNADVKAVLEQIRASKDI